MSPESRFYGHNKNQIDLIKVFLNGADGRIRFDRDTSFNAEGAYLFYSLSRILCGLHMKVHYVGSRLDKILDISYRLGYHKMYVENKSAVFSYAFVNRGSEADVRHKYSVHNVYVEILRSGPFYYFYLAVKLAEIGGKHRRRKFFHFNLFLSSNISLYMSTYLRYLDSLMSSPTWAFTSQYLLSSFICLHPLYLHFPR